MQQKQRQFSYLKHANHMSTVDMDGFSLILMKQHMMHKLIGILSIILNYFGHQKILHSVENVDILITLLQVVRKYNGQNKKKPIYPNCNLYTTNINLLNIVNHEHTHLQINQKNYHLQTL